MNEFIPDLDWGRRLDYPHHALQGALDDDERFSMFISWTRASQKSTAELGRADWKDMLRTLAGPRTLSEKTVYERLKQELPGDILALTLSAWRSPEVLKECLEECYRQRRSLELSLPAWSHLIDRSLQSPSLTASLHAHALSPLKHGTTGLFSLCEMASKRMHMTNPPTRAHTQRWWRQVHAVLGRHQHEWALFWEQRAASCANGPTPGNDVHVRRWWNAVVIMAVRQPKDYSNPWWTHQTRPSVWTHICQATAHVFVEINPLVQRKFIGEEHLLFLLLGSLAEKDLFAPLMQLPSFGEGLPKTGMEWSYRFFKATHPDAPSWESARDMMVGMQMPPPEFYRAVMNGVQKGIAPAASHSPVDFSP